MYSGTIKKGLRDTVCQRVKKRMYVILDGTIPGDKSANMFQVFIMGLIILNVLGVIFETVNAVSARYAAVFYYFEVFSVVVFTVEYLLRLITCTSDTRYGHPVKGRLRFITSPLAIVDALAILPFYAPMIIPLDLRFIRALRLFRLFRLFKLGRYSEALKILGRVIANKKEELSIALFTVFTLLVFSSSLMFYVEHEAQPTIFSSIPAAMWWGIATLTTVGYGDIYLVTMLGKAFAGVMAILGIGMFALPAGILSSGFSDLMHNTKERKKTCPHCGKEIS